MARRVARDGQTPPVKSHRSSALLLVLRCRTSSRRHSMLVHSQFTFRCGCWPFQGNKKPCLHGVSRVEKNSFDSLPAYISIIQIAFGTFSYRGQGLAKAKHKTRIMAAMTDRFRDQRGRPSRGRYVGASFHRTCRVISNMQRYSLLILRGVELFYILISELNDG